MVQTDVDRFVSQTDPGERLTTRGDLVERMRDIAKRAKFREDNLSGRLKLRKAEFDKCRADYELAVAEGAPQDRLDSLLAIAQAKQAEVVEATQANQVANTHRKGLEAILRDVTATEDAAAKILADHRNKVGQLAKTLKDIKLNILKIGRDLAEPNYFEMKKMLSGKGFDFDPQTVNLNDIRKKKI